MVTSQDIKKYINAELGDRRLYAKLAEIAPNEEYRILLMDFSEDEKRHADKLTEMFQKMTGKGYSPNTAEPIIVNSFFETLRKRMLDESYDYGKYMSAARNADDENMKLQFEAFADDENIHAHRLMYMISGY